MLLVGNNNIKATEKLDTGKKWIDANGVGHTIFQKTLAVGAMPNATLKNVAHGEALSLTKYAQVIALWASDGTTIKTKNSSGVTIDITATNVAISAAANLSTFINGTVVIEFCL